MILMADIKLVASIFVSCFIDGFVPIHASEAILIGVSISSPGTSRLIFCMLAAATAHLVAKTIFYFTGRGVIHLPLRGFQKKVDELRVKYEAHQNRPAPFLFFSVLTGMPPYTAAAVLCGIFRYSLIRFLLITLSGLMIKYTVVILFPQSIKAVYQFFETLCH